MGDALLVADIGGTNARFALADPHAASPLLVASVREFPVAAFPSLAEAAAHYLDQVGTRARRGVFAVAGRIDGDQARITNHPWVISRSRTAQMLGFDQVHLLNDFAAQAMAISLYRPEDLVAIGGVAWNPAPLDQPRTYAVLGPGTGLGVGGLVFGKLGGGAGAGWSNTNEGKVIAAAFLDAHNQLVTQVRALEAKELPPPVPTHKKPVAGS